MAPLRLHAVRGKGSTPLGQLLAPFFSALLPAFRVRSDQIYLHPTRSGLKITYGGESSSVSFPHLVNYATVAFLRILILSEMNIGAQGTQTGAFKVRYGTRMIPVETEASISRSQWTLTLRPQWVAARSVVRRHG